MMVDLLESMAPMSNDQAAVSKVLAWGTATLMVLKEVTKLQLRNGPQKL